MSDQDWSVPETDVLASIRDILAADRPAVVATVVDVEGSAYRRPGAKMVIEEGGAGLGHITAGCLEDEVFELTAEVLAAGEPRVETYDLMEDDDDVWGLGVGCNGVIDVLLEPLTESYAPAVEAFSAEEPFAILTVLGGDAPKGAKAFYHPGEGVVPETGSFPDEIATAAQSPAAELTDQGGADTLTFETETGSVDVFIDGIQPAPRLMVFGSGHDVGPVVELGKKTGFHVTVVSFRGAADLAERFPAADETIATSPPNVREAVDLNDRTYAVLMTHNFIDDRLTLDELVQTEVPYVGLMGPRERFEEMEEEFAAEGRTFTEAELSGVYTPIGLDLGGGSPYQIATSIVAEALAVANDRAPKHLKEREGPIHDRSEIEAAASDD